MAPTITSRRTLLVLLLFALANLKSLPLAWHLRVLYHFLTNLRWRPIAPSPLRRRTRSSSSSPHPLFAPTQISTHTPLLETDYNLHKSNATYLTDMDVSRAKLMTRLLSPGLRGVDAQLRMEGHGGRMVVVLGAVHVSFRREIGVYERVRVRSRVLGWDGKWIVVVTYFVRRRKREGREELCAVGLSKYVVKKGRFTVRPERVFAMAGWLPEKPDAEGRRSGSGEGADDPASASDNPNDVDGEGRGDPAQITHLAEELDVAAATPDRVGTQVVSGNEGGEASRNADAWSWEEVEKERLRGLELAKGWLALDKELCDEFERD